MPYSPNIPRCQHIKVNGIQCGSPALRSDRFCYFHKRWHEHHITIAEAKSLKVRPSINVPVLEDANSIQVALMQVIHLLLAGEIEHRTAGLALYGLQTASINVKHVKFEHFRKEELVIDPETVDQTQLDDWQWNNQDFENEENEDAEMQNTDAEQEEKQIPQLPKSSLLALLCSSPDGSGA
jgi:hypothetical protein